MHLLMIFIVGPLFKGEVKSKEIIVSLENKPRATIELLKEVGKNLKSQVLKFKSKIFSWKRGPFSLKNNFVDDLLKEHKNKLGSIIKSPTKSNKKF